jgi:hypothetical protein
MSTETTAHPFAVTWSTDPADPCLTRWKRNGPRAKWTPWLRFPNAQDAHDAARANGLCQLIPRGDWSRTKQEEPDA